MKLYKIRESMKGMSIFNMPLRVTYYARVSTDSDDQLNSLENQTSYYPDFIKSHTNWTFVDGYVDEGLSGASVRKREDFQRMIADAESGKFDLILTKEITRFARNTLDSIQYTRQLLACGVGVFFQNDNINTFDEDSELRLTIMASIAQDELRRHSSRVKFGHQQAIKHGVVLGCNKLFGYIWAKGSKCLAINEDEAQIVREIFELYATGEYGVRSISNILWDKGYRNRTGTKIAQQVIAKMIQNPRYKGYYVGGKTKSIDMFTKKTIALPREDWTIYKDETGAITPAIVSEDLWDKANDVFSRRSGAFKARTGTYNHANLMTGKIHCTECDRTYYHRRKGSVDKWVCSGKIDNGSDSCKSFRLHQEELVQILIEVFNETVTTTEDVVEKYINMYQELDDNKSISKEIARLNNQISVEFKRREKLLDHNISGILSNKDFAAMASKCAEVIEAAESRICELEEQLGSKQELKIHLDALRTTLNNAKRDIDAGSISRSFVERYIDMIYATPLDESTVRLDIKLCTGVETEKYLSQLRGHWDGGSKPDPGGNSKGGRLGTRLSNILPDQLAMPLYLSWLTSERPSLRQWRGSTSPLAIAI